MDEPTKGKSFLWRLKYHANALYAFYYGIGPTYLFRHSAAHTLSLAEKVRSFLFSLELAEKSPARS